jgi:hypothetical protein
MSKNQPLINASSPAIYKMTKVGKIDFYFDSADLSEHQQEFEEMKQSGWVLEEEVRALPSYLRLRRQALEDAGLVKLKFSWGYKKK